MKLSIKVLSVIAIAFLLNSCSSNKEKIQDKWWYEISNYGDDIVMFTADGKSININDDKKYDCKIEGSEIAITVSSEKTETINIASVTDSELILSNGKNEKEYRLAKEKDFIVGTWKTSINGEKIKIEFEKDGDVEMRKGYKKDREGVYSFIRNKLKLDNEEYSYKFSGDYMTLELTGKENITLRRRI